MAEESISQSLQESLLTLLGFSDKYAPMLASMLDERHFEQPYRDIAVRLIEYQSRWRKTPGDAHIDDVFDHVLGDQGHPKREIYLRILKGMISQSKGINGEYVTARATEFVRRQNLKAGVLAAAQRYEQGEENLTVDVEQILLNALKDTSVKQDPGVFLGDPTRALNFLDSVSNSEFTTGIRELDRVGAQPTRKELILLMAARGKGKSWWLDDLGKRAVMRGHSVLHITLEMSEERVIQRYFQSMFAMAKRDEEYRKAFFVLDDLGRLAKLVRKEVRPDRSLSDPDVREFLQERIKEWGARFDHLLVKQFPTGQLTIPKLCSYLDSLDRIQRFTPDLLIVDYPKLMRIDPENTRLSLGKTVEDLRGIAVERNMAVAVVHQANRKGEESGSIKGYHASEDISVMATTDVAITYSRTEAEEQQSLARLYLTKIRNDEGGQHILISQDYKTGQFCVDSVPMGKKYKDVLKELTGKEDTYSDDEDGGLLGGD